METLKWCYENGFYKELNEADRKVMKSDKLRKYQDVFAFMYKGVLEKTGEEIIAECAVKDRIWGIGLSMKDENRHCIDRWRGQNLLGKILMRVREEIKHQKKEQG